MIKTAVFNTVFKHNMPLKGKHVVVCVSGGADSMALLHFLHTYVGELGIEKLSACHFNHGLRGAESDRDEKLVMDFCKTINRQLVVGHGNMNERKRPAGFSEEMWARKLRKEFVDSVCAGEHAVAAMAHTLNDSVETMLFNLSRGSGIRGMRGISPVYGNVVRPFIEVSRNDIERYCADYGVPFVTDSSNLTDKYSRNRIRHHVMPAFDRVNPAFLQNAKRMMSHAEDAFAYIDSRCDELIAAASDGAGRYDRSRFMEQEPYIVRCALKRLLDAEFDMIDEATVDECLKVISGEKKAVQVRKNARLIAEDGSFFICGETGDIVVERPQPVGVTPDFATVFGRFFISFELADACIYDSLKKSSQKECSNLVDYDKINGVLLLRTREPGDIFSSAKRNNTKSLKKLYNELHIPNALRNAYPLLADEEGIVWLPGEGAAKRCAADRNSKNILKINLEEIEQ